MSKLIDQPKQCKWRDQLTTRLGFPTGVHICKLMKERNSTLYCTNAFEFLKDCPLEEGIPKKLMHWP